MTTQYRVVKPYTTYYFGFPLTLPVGTTLEWFEQARGYVADAVYRGVTGYCALVGKWATEAWRDYFEKVEAS